jgi:hypothetical protein
VAPAYADTPKAPRSDSGSPSSAPADATNDAATHFGRGVTYYGEGDYPAALVEFKRAYSIAPSWRVLFNIGQSHFQLHEYVEAHTALERFLQEGGDQVKPKQRELAQQELASLSERIGRVTVDSNVTGAAVSVDDQVVGTTPLANPVLMSAGIRRVSAVADGRTPVEQRVSVAGGDTITVHLDFATPAQAPVAATKAPSTPMSLDSTPPEAPARPPNRVPAYIAFGGAIAGVAVGTTFGVLALDEHSQLNRSCNAGKGCPASDDSEIHAQSRNAIISDVGFGVAIVGAVVGVTLWLTAPHGRTGQLGSRTAAWNVGPGGISGTF